MDKLKSGKFWAALIAVAVMLAQLFGVKIEQPYVGEIINTVCAACVLFGIGKSDRSGTAGENGTSDKTGDKSEDESSHGTGKSDRSGTAGENGTSDKTGDKSEDESSHGTGKGG